jgi:hypothetical protein
VTKKKQQQKGNNNNKAVGLREFLGMEDREGIVLTQAELSALNGKGSQEGGNSDEKG